MTRWATGDLAGRAMREFAGDGVRLLVEKAVQDDGTMLCPGILSRDEYEFKIRPMSPEIAAANYQQHPIDLEGRLYKSFKTYRDLPKGPLVIRNYTDTADQGSDYLCSITYAEYQHEAYVLDVYYTQEGMEITEPELARRLAAVGCQVAKIESNNGGRGFARSIERIMRELLHTNRCRVEWFHQGENKVARILANSTWVQDHIYFPENWADCWPEYHTAMYRYQKEGKNAHDDAPDATTGVAEQFNKGGGWGFSAGRIV